MTDSASEGRVERHALGESVYLETEVGDYITPEIKERLESLLFFAAAICGRRPEELRLGHLVGALGRPQDQADG